MKFNVMININGGLSNFDLACNGIEDVLDKTADIVHILGTTGENVTITINSIIIPVKREDPKTERWRKQKEEACVSQDD